MGVEWYKRTWKQTGEVASQNLIYRLEVRNNLYWNSELFYNLCSFLVRIWNYQTTYFLMKNIYL